ncbi:hypothetical protein CLOBOL_03089 [Enterocloster bolteae ATCC BAA-613]|uniref:Uncharacterized protein n=1 Tax=Enterocloster bolteae (strain ATCC BAA-613 / DSM 15670 / CCUG 46953 / JCM 12243 / WAL 16351) TaxID=411902 RepID=A8RRT6_ENTBW|nr:hypothetical protein CLOBOL_03089 [Enterocloster bolteae ATCC BAA-613]
MIDSFIILIFNLGIVVGCYKNKRDIRSFMNVSGPEPFRRPSA